MTARRSWFVFGMILFLVLAGCSSRTNASPSITSCAPGKDCSPRSLTATVAAVTPALQDLGWGEVRGLVSDTISGAPIEGATVTCTHRSNHPVALCSGTVKTGSDGSFVFPGIFFQSTDQIEVTASHPSYGGNALHQGFFTRPRLYINFSLPLVDRTPQPCCTPPACREDEVYSCPGVCPCGCGTTCATKTSLPNGYPTQLPFDTPTPQNQS